MVDTIVFLIIRRWLLMLKSSGLLRTIPFSKLEKWYVEYYLNANSLNSKFEMMKLESIITPIKRRIKKADYDGTLPVVSKIVFKTGEIIFRSENKTGMDLLHVKKGDMLVSSINFHQGAVALNNIGDFVCSTHYQTFRIDETKVIPEYLILVLRSHPFIRMIAGIKANGIKNESGYSFIGSFEIPVPSIPQQNKILEKLHSTLTEAERSLKSGDDFCVDLLYNIQSEVSDLKRQEPKSISASTSLLQTISFTSTRRWEVDYILKEGQLESIYSSFKCPICSISEITIESLFGLSVKASLSQGNGMIPILRMANIVNGEIDCNGLKYLPRRCAVTDKEPNKWLLRKGDFLINRTNSKELVGKTAVFNLDGDYTYASYVIRYRFDTTKVLPEYVNILFMLPIVRAQIDILSRQTAGQCNINSDEIGAIKIPVPSIPEQHTIVKKNYSTRAGANTYYGEARKLREKAIIDFETAIFSEEDGID